MASTGLTLLWESWWADDSSGNNGEVAFRGEVGGKDRVSSEWNGVRGRLGGNGCRHF